MTREVKTAIKRYPLLSIVALSVLPTLSMTPPCCGQIDQRLRNLISEAGIEPLQRINDVDPDMFNLGQALFFDKELSGNRDMACATCHHPSLSTGDARSLSLGTKATGGLGQARELGQDRDFIPRNAPDLFERGVTEWRSMFWDSRVAQYQNGDFATPAGENLPPGVHSLLGAQAMFPVTSAAEMRGSPGDMDAYNQPNELAEIDETDLGSIWSAITARLMKIDGYVEMFQKAYPNTQISELGFEHAAEAIGAFEAQAFTFLDSPWDQYVAGDDEALTESAKRGALLFHGKANCASCHSGNLFTDQQHHNIGVPQLGPGKADPLTHLDAGRSRVSLQEGDEFAFRTPSLRNAAITGPWMHNGAYTALENAVAHYTDRMQALANFDRSQLESQLQDRVHIDEQTLVRIERTISTMGEASEPLSSDEIEDLMAFIGSLTTTSLLKLDQSLPDSVPSGLAVDKLAETSDIALVYDALTGALGVRGPEGVQFDGVDLVMAEGRTGELADVFFRTGEASWLGKSVFFAKDAPEEQAFHSLVGVLGDYILENDEMLGELLPTGLTGEQLQDVLWSRVSILGQPGTIAPSIVVIPEASSLVLLVLALATMALRHSRKSAGRLTVE